MTRYNQSVSRKRREQLVIRQTSFKDVVIINTLVNSLYHDIMSNSIYTISTYLIKVPFRYEGVLIYWLLE